MGLFGYHGDREIDGHDLCEMSKLLGIVVTGNPVNDVSRNLQYTDPMRIKYHTPDLFFRYIAAVNALDPNGNNIMNEFNRIRECASILKKMIDSYTNHICDLTLSEKLQSLKSLYDEIESNFTVICKSMEDEELESVRKQKDAELKAEWEKKDRKHFNLIAKFQNAAQDDYEFGNRYIKRRQFLRREIYRQLLADPRMTGKCICENINKLLESAPKDVKDVVFAVGMVGYRQRFTPQDIYGEWNSVKDEIKNGTFGYNYPDDCPDDYDAAKEYLKKHMVEILQPDGVVDQSEKPSEKNESVPDDKFEIFDTLNESKADETSVVKVVCDTLNFDCDDSDDMDWDSDDLDDVIDKSPVSESVLNEVEQSTW